MTLLAALVLMAPAYAKRDGLQVVVADPYIEMRTGPGRGYPIFHVADRGAEIAVLKRRTDWFEVRTDRGVKGWVQQEQLARTMETTGEPVSRSPIRAGTNSPGANGKCPSPSATSTAQARSP